MQHGIGRAVGAVLDVRRLRAGELIIRVKTRHLQLSFELQVDDGRVAHIEEIVVLDEIIERKGMYQQRRLARTRILSVQIKQFRLKILQQTRRGALSAHSKAHPPTRVHALGKWTKSKSDDRPFQPTARRTDYFIDTDDFIASDYFR